jgi:hypothetical protein
VTVASGWYALVLASFVAILISVDGSPVSFLVPHHEENDDLGGDYSYPQTIPPLNR